VTPTPIDVRAGTLIDYRLSLLGLPFSWRTRIEVFEPERRFIDTQLRGPYSLWRHLHEFEEVEGGTLMRDRVDYAVPFGPLGEVARAIFVTRTVERIFDFRAHTIAERFWCDVCSCVMRAACAACNADHPAIRRPNGSRPRRRPWVSPRAS
jgi:ligand-binding SRPBCC domain-containing protein